MAMKSECSSFDRVLADTVEALEESRIPYMFIGGIASGGLGRPRSTRDIDIFVKPEDADAALTALGRHGFVTEKTDVHWLYKGFKEEILVDVIFKSKGEIYLDAEMAQRMVTAEYHGKRLRSVGPEDLVIIKALAHSELTPGHWHDALALLSRSSLDWSYLVHRARRAPRRILSLLLYAQSSDIGVPKTAIDELYCMVFGELPGERPKFKVYRFDENWAARMKESFAEDPRINELDIQVELAENKLLLRGEVNNEDRRELVAIAAREFAPGYEIENQIRVARLKEPVEVEEFR
jgi:predicted nucleotidyltransferase